MALTRANRHVDTTVMGGTLAVLGGGTLGSGNVALGPGTTLDLSAATATPLGGVIPNSASLSLSTGSVVAFGDNPLNEVVQRMYVNGAVVAAGTYDQFNFPGGYITGSGGSITVTVPEPGSLAAFCTLLGLAAMRRRRHRNARPGASA
jgi:hypothetical protein